MHKELYLIRNPHRVPDLIFWYCVNLKIEVWKAMITRIRFPQNNFATFWKLHNFDFPLRIFRSVAALQYSTYHEAVTSVLLKSKTNFLTLKICKRVQVHSQRHALRISTHLIGYLYARLIVAELSCLRKQTLNLSQADVSVVYNACSLREKKNKENYSHSNNNNNNHYGLYFNKTKIHILCYMNTVIHYKINKLIKES